MPEAENSVELKSKTPFSRRSFLRISGLLSLALFADSSLAHFTRATTLTKRFWEDVERGTLGMSKDRLEGLKQEVENQFAIDVVDTAEQSETSTYLFFFDRSRQNMEKFPVHDPTASELVVLSKILSDLPPHFYRPFKHNQNRVKFIIYDSRGVKEGLPTWNCSCGGPETISHPEIRIPQDEFSPLVTFYNNSRWKVVHELTHRVFFQLGDGFTDKLKKSLSIQDETHLKERFQMTIPFGRLWYGSTDWREFVAVGGEVYLSGRDKFVERYKPHLGEPAASNFYDVMKQDIFRGYEY